MLSYRWSPPRLPRVPVPRYRRELAPAPRWRFAHPPGPRGPAIPHRRDSASVPRAGVGPRDRGLTLIELLIACALAAIILSFAIPAFERFTLDARRTRQVNALVRALHLARSSAILRAVPVAICRSTTGASCTPGSRDWSAGYIVFANLDRDSPAQVDRGEPLLHVEPRIEAMTVTANRDALLYWPVSMAGTTATITFCDERGTAAARAVIISHTGRPRISQKDSSGRPIRCP